MKDKIIHKRLEIQWCSVTQEVKLLFYTHHEAVDFARKILLATQLNAPNSELKFRNIYHTDIQLDFKSNHMIQWIYIADLENLLQTHSNIIIIGITLEGFGIGLDIIPFIKSILEHGFSISADQICFQWPQKNITPLDLLQLRSQEISRFMRYRFSMDIEFTFVTHEVIRGCMTDDRLDEIDDIKPSLDIEYIMKQRRLMKHSGIFVFFPKPAQGLVRQSRAAVSSELLEDQDTLGTLGWIE